MIEPEFVAVVAEGLGIKPTDDALKTLAPDVEYRLREIVQEAAKFARHAKRTAITPEDVNLAFRLRNVEPVYGLSGNTDPARFVRAAGQLDVVYAEDPVVPLANLLETPLPAVPWEAGVSLHWLAVNGRQPMVPENAPLLPPSHREKRRRTEAARVSAPALVPPPETTTATATATATATPAAAAAAGTPASAPSLGTAGTGTTAGGAVEEGILVRAPLKHLVSKELHLYFEKASAALAGAAPPPAPASPELAAVLASLRADAGLQPLAPYLAHMIAEGVAKNLASAPRLLLYLRAAAAMGGNPNLDLGPYLHEILPAVLTCLLARAVGAPPVSGSGGGGKKKQREEEEQRALAPDALHWGVRDEAARAAAALCGAYPDAAPRVQRQMLTALTAPGAALPTKYGAVVGLEAQGPRAVRALLLPNLIPAVAALQRDAAAGGGTARQAAILRVRGALLAASGHCIYLSGLCDPWNGREVDKEAGAVAAAEKTKAAPAKRGRAGSEKAAADGERKVERQRVAKMTPQEAEEAVGLQRTASGGTAKARGGAAGKRSSTGKKGGAGAKKGGKADASVTPATLPPVPLSDVFGEETVDEGEAKQEKAAANEAMKDSRVPMYPLSPEGRSFSKNADKLMEGGVPAENYLAEAWKEDFPASKLRQAMEELFGVDVQPYERRSGAVEAAEHGVGKLAAARAEAAIFL